MNRFLVIASLAVLIPAGMAQGKKHTKPLPKTAPKALSDAALNKITAAGPGVSATVSNGVVNFQGSDLTNNGLVTAAGTLAVLSAPAVNTTNIGSISLSGSAQQNLSSVININAVNSTISVLLNLNVNLNSTVGTVMQSNLAGKH